MAARDEIEALRDALREQIKADLTCTRDAIAHLERELASRVELARAAGLTWQQIADALGVTGQAAQQRYGRGRSQ